MGSTSVTELIVLLFSFHEVISEQIGQVGCYCDYVDLHYVFKPAFQFRPKRIVD